MSLGRVITTLAVAGSWYAAASYRTDVTQHIDSSIRCLEYRRLANNGEDELSANEKCRSTLVSGSKSSGRRTIAVRHVRCAFDSHVLSHTHIRFSDDDVGDSSRTEADPGYIEVSHRWSLPHRFRQQDFMRTYEAGWIFSPLEATMTLVGKYEPVLCLQSSSSSQDADAPNLSS